MKYEQRQHVSRFFVKRASEYVNGKLAICTVIDSQTAIAQQRQKSSRQKMPYKWCKRTDMVINIGDVKDGRFDVVEDEIRQIHEACNGHILKSLSKQRLYRRRNHQDV